MIRIIAIITLFIPGVIAAIGIKLMRDTLFEEYNTFFLHPGVQFFAGLILFLAGVLFLGGFIVYRDRKKKKQENNT